MLLAHPFYAERDIPVLLGDHVTAEDGTGAVHTAPGHGQEDFAVGQQYGLIEQYTAGAAQPGRRARRVPAVDAAGRRRRRSPGCTSGRPTTPSSKCCAATARCSRSRQLDAQLSALLAAQDAGRVPRHAAVVHLDGAGATCAATRWPRSSSVQWFPDWGEARIAGMVEGRPDWCISRQRTWGVPIALFVHRETGEPHPRIVGADARRSPSASSSDGIDAWYALDAAELLGDEAARLRQDHRHPRCLVRLRRHPRVRAGAAPQDGLRKPADLYLEGSDQHRGWFQSLAAHRRGDGRRRAVPAGADARLHRRRARPQDVQVARQRASSRRRSSTTLGADILRLWIASTDYRNEMSLSDEILKRSADAYRRIRNTARFLLGNLHGFDPARDLLPLDDMVALDRWIVHRACAAAGEDRGGVRALRLRRDRAGAGATSAASTSARCTWTSPRTACTRCARTRAAGARAQIGDVPHRRGVRALDRADPQLHRRRDVGLPARAGAASRGNVLFTTWYDGLAPLPDDAALSADGLRAPAGAARAGQPRCWSRCAPPAQIGAALEAEIELRCSVGRPELAGAAGRRAALPADQRRRARGAGRPTATGVIGVFAAPPPSPSACAAGTTATTSARIAAHPQLCGRCVENVEGPGEDEEVVLMAPASKPNALAWLAVVGRSSSSSTSGQGLGAGVACRNTPPVPVIDGFWNWYRTYNTGAAFSFLATPAAGRSTSSWCWRSRISGAAGVLAGAARRAATGSTALPFALVIGGAIGNVIDRLLHGHVVDFIQWHWRRPLLAGVQHRRLRRSWAARSASRCSACCGGKPTATRRVESRAMDILLANPRGFCAGVDRAIEIVKRALEMLGAPIYVRHEVVHNRFVVDDLQAARRDLRRGTGRGAGRRHRHLQRARRVAGGARRGRRGAA